MIRALSFFMALVLVAGLVATGLAADMVTPKYVEETASSGVDTAYMGEWQYMVGGGVATFDCSGDGFPDMFIAGGTAPAAFYLNESTRGGALKFKKQTSGLELTEAVGAYPLDVDSDGITDLMVLRVGESVLMRGLGNCQFQRANEAWGFSGGDAWWTAFAATWEKGNALPTLALGSYIDRTQDIAPWGTCTDNWLERPAADDKGYAPPLALTPSYCALSMLFTDWNLSGTPSLRIANDREYYEGGQEQMWKVLPGAAPVLYTPAEGWKPLKIWGMGIAEADVTGDGYPDYFITSMADNKLQTLTAPPPDGAKVADFKDIAFARGVTAHRPTHGDDLRPSTAWHTQFEDVNNDGRLDLFIAKGNVDKMPDFANSDPNNLMLQQPDGKFVDVAEAAGVASTQTSRGAALPDFNLDGLVDLVVVNRRASAQVWRNVTETPNHFVAITLHQPGVNPDAVGSRVEVKVGEHIDTREVSVGGGHVSGQLGPLHFGLGSEVAAEVRVTWPNGAATPWKSVQQDSFVVIDSERGVLLMSTMEQKFD